MTTPLDSVEAMARLVREAMEYLESPHDANILINRIKLLELGLPAEDEFSFLLNSFGRCRLVHKLDQLQLPRESRRDYRVPDLMVVFERHGRPIPALVEIKSARKNRLSWRDDYLCALVKYATLLNLPLLVAWKFHGLWMLFDWRHFAQADTRWRIELELALKQNLLGVLAGDFAIHLEPGVGLHFVIRKERKTEELQVSATKTEQHWEGVVEDVYWSNCRGERVDSRHLGALLCFLFALEAEDQSAVDDTHVNQSFVVAADRTSCFAHLALVAALRVADKQDGKLRWRRILERDLRPVSYEALRTAAEKGIAMGMVKYVMDQMPQEWPDFLGPHPSS